MSDRPQWDSVADILGGRKTGQEVHLRGWVHRQRSAGKMAFIVLRDGTGVVQCTVKAGVVEDDASLDAAKSALIESSVKELVGTVVADERAPGGFEVKATKFVLHQKSADFPLRGEQGTEFELDMRHLWLRSTELSAILRIKHRLYKAVRDFYDGEGFYEVDPSVITTNAVEGGSTLFTFYYFGQKAYLSQSAQMYLEGCIFGLPKVYCITPSFRAEKSRTSKHLTEFHHLEAEYAWWDAEESRQHQEKLVTHLAHTIAKECGADLKLLGQDPARLLAVKAPFERMDYADAIQELKRQGFHIEYGDDFGVPHEKALTEGKTSPIFINDWPAKIKAFYMAKKEGTDRVLCSDLLAPDGYGEIIGGSQRSEDEAWMKERLVEQMKVALNDADFAEEGRQILAHDERKYARVWFSEGAPVPANLTAARFAIIVDEVAHIVSGGAMGATLGDTEPSYWTVFLTGGTGGKLHRRIAIANDAGPSSWQPLVLGKLQSLLLEPYQWYFDLRKYGSVPHSGFGLGVERLLRWFTGQEHIRDMLPYPRTPSRAYP